MTSLVNRAANEALIHCATDYTDTEGYVGDVLPFLHDGLSAGEPILVMAPGPKLELLEASLDGSASQVTFLDTTEVLRNPVRMIPATHRFAKAHPGQRIRVVEEPIWPGRSAAEVAEGIRHEACVNILCADVAATFLCAYDSQLDSAVRTDAERIHPYRMEDGEYRSNAGYIDPAVRLFLQDPLSGTPGEAESLEFHHGDLALVRNVVKDRAGRVGLSEERIWDLLLAVNEVATNTLFHTKTPGTLRIWWDTETLVCEVSDHGHITDPLIGRIPPALDAESGRGMWMVNQLCDLVEVRSDVARTIIRMHISIGAQTHSPRRTRGDEWASL